MTHLWPRERRSRAVAATVALLAASFLVGASGCDRRRSPAHPQSAATEEDGGVGDAGSFPGPTFTAEPGDIRI